MSWTVDYPKISIELIQSFNLDKSASIIDIGGGDSLLVDTLIELGFTDLSVLDISGKVLVRAQNVLVIEQNASIGLKVILLILIQLKIIHCGMIEPLFNF